MKVRCPKCKTEQTVPDEVHYQELPCPTCGARFQAVTEATQQMSRDFIDQYLKSLENKDE